MPSHSPAAIAALIADQRAVVALLDESALDRTGEAVARLRRVLAYLETLRTA